MIVINQSANVFLDVLTLRARVAAEAHLQRALDARCPAPPAARTVARRLVSAGLVQAARVSVAYPELTAPLYRCNSRQGTPDFHAACYQLDKRWRQVTPRRVTVCWATNKAARLFGGTARFPAHVTQMEHDLTTTSVLVRLTEIDPDAAAHWLGEDVLRRDFAPNLPCLAQMPDAAIVREGVVTTWIEAGGQYAPERLMRLHEHCRRYGLSYELW